MPVGMIEVTVKYKREVDTSDYDLENDTLEAAAEEIRKELTDDEDLIHEDLETEVLTVETRVIGG